MKNILPLLGVLVLAIACNNKTSDYNKISAKNIFSDKVVQQIAEFQDRRNTDSLLVFFGHENPKHREAAALAFASVQDSESVVYLNRLLKDSNTDVRIAAIYALGQIATDSAQNSLLYSLHIEDTMAVRKEVLAALGKCITQDNYSQLTSFTPKDSLEMEGLSWGLYRAAIRGVVSAQGVALAVEYLRPEYSFQTRLGAAHLLARGRDLNISNHLQLIKGSALYDKSAFVRMASASALRHGDEGQVFEELSTKIIMDEDYRVRINAIRALKSMDSAKVKPILMNSLLDENNQVAVTAAQALAPLMSVDNNRNGIKGIPLKGLNWRVRAILLGGMLAVDNMNTSLIDKINEAYDTTNNSYEKAGLLSALGHSPLTYARVVTETFDIKDKVISTAGIGALATMRAKDNFPNELTQAFADMLKEACLTGDLAMIGTASNILINPDFAYKDYYDSIQFLYEAKGKLSLPKDIEGMKSLQVAIDYFEGNESPSAVINEYNHPIDWQLISTIDSHQKMKIITSKGVIDIEMMVNESPGSVANFITLANIKYYDGKNFHRIAPNFVAQGGCNRGDGWGGEDYSIRSELGPQHYKEGYIGMASAGKDTEGTQWFITHSPNPHLDGRYSIFARVTKGMEVVHQLGIGDVIESVSLQNIRE
jgi:cyclophilin family peptidyl-prolyl cis-trans isomerase/HEAT repeat protein